MDKETALEITKNMVQIFDDNWKRSIGCHNEPLIKEINSLLIKLEIFSIERLSLGEQILVIRESINVLFSKNCYKHDHKFLNKQVQVFYDYASRLRTRINMV